MEPVVHFGIGRRSMWICCRARMLAMAKELDSMIAKGTQTI
jgi:hypothetical protein